MKVPPQYRWILRVSTVLAALGFACMARATPALTGTFEVLDTPGFHVQYQNCDGTLPTADRLTVPRRLSSRYTGMTATVRAELSDGKPTTILLLQGDEQLFEAVHWHVERARFASGPPDCVVLRYQVTDTVRKAAEIIDFRVWVDVAADAQGRILDAQLVEELADGTLAAAILRQVSKLILEPVVRGGVGVPFETSLRIAVHMVPTAWTSYEMSTSLVRHGARPVRMRFPGFPRRLASLALKGAVVLEFMVSEDGKPMDPKVVQSEPKGVFDREALGIIRGWRYKPEVVDGEPVVTGPVRQVINFDSGMRPEDLPKPRSGFQIGR